MTKFESNAASQTSQSTDKARITGSTGEASTRPGEQGGFLVSPAPIIGDMDITITMIDFAGQRTRPWTIGSIHTGLLTPHWQTKWECIDYLRSLATEFINDHPATHPLVSWGIVKLEPSMLEYNTSESSKQVINLIRKLPLDCPAVPMATPPREHGLPYVVKLRIMVYAHQTGSGAGPFRPRSNPPGTWSTTRGLKMKPPARLATWNREEHPPRRTPLKPVKRLSQTQPRNRDLGAKQKPQQLEQKPMVPVTQPRAVRSPRPALENVIPVVGPAPTEEEKEQKFAEIRRARNKRRKERKREQRAERQARTAKPTPTAEPALQTPPVSTLSTPATSTTTPSTSSPSDAGPSTASGAPTDPPRLDSIDTAAAALQKVHLDELAKMDTNDVCDALEKQLEDLASKASSPVV